MTSPEPGGGIFANAWDTVATAPRWLVISVVVGGGVLAYVLIRTATKDDSGAGDGSSYQEDSRKSWRQKATDLLIARGYNPQQVQSAMSHYFDGGSLSPQDSALISAAIMQLGWPDTSNSTAPDYATSNPITNPGPGAPRGGNASSSTGGVGNSGTPDLQNVDDSGSDAPTGNWYIVSMGFGWTSTFRGIAAYYYGNPTLGTTLMQYNPGVATSDYARIPPGTRVTVPRQLQH